MRLLTIIALFAGLLPICSADDPDPCAPLLSGGVFNKIEQSSQYAYAASAKATYCSQFQSLHDSGHHADANAFINLNSYGADYTDSQRDAVSEAICNSSASTTDLATAAKLISTTVDPTIVKGFVECEEARGKQLLYTVRYIGDEAIPSGIEISAKYLGAVPIPVDRYVLTGGKSTECHGALTKEGAMLSQSEKTITCTRPLYAPGRHKDNRGVPVAAEFMDISIPNAQHRIYAALGSVPDPAMKCQSNPKFFTGTWSLTKIDTKDQDGSFKYQLDEVNCIVTGNSVVAPDSHVLRFWVDGEKAAGYVRRTLSGCTTYVPYNIDIIPGKNQFHVVIGASGCDMPASQELVFTKN